ncbi:hypothetical protein [Paraburkholderia sediminicola]|uniref:hypothetical protein n=1 Tax=Paraburkholderia sediminicola TaxID=458836 RepID=UPI0038B7D31D
MLKRLLLCFLLLPGIANAQFTNGQVLTAAQLNNAFANTLQLTGGILTGPLSVTSLSVTSSPIGVASGGTNCAAASGACLDNITGFSSTGFLERTGSGAYTFVADPLPVAHGGTGSTTATGALNALGALSAAGIYDAVTAYSADPTSTTDSTTAIQNATNACQAGGGGVIWLRAGNYQIAGTITNSGANVCKYQGAGPGNATGGTSGSRLVSASAAADILDISSSGGTYVEGVGFDSSVTRTGGNFLFPSGSSNNGLIRNVAFSNYFQGLNLSWNNGTVDHALFYKPVANTGVGVNIGGNNAGCIVLNDIEMFPPGSGSQPAYGVKVTSSQCLLISNSDVIQQGTDLALIPGNGQAVSSTYVSNSFFDTAVNGVMINATGTGNVIRAVFTNSWASSHSNVGVTVENNGTGVVQGVQFVNHIGINNTNYGFQINGGTGNATDIGVADSLFANNGSHGIVVANGSTSVTLSGDRSGAYGGVAGNGGYGVFVGSSVTNLNILGNQLVGNTSGSISDNTAGTTKTIKANTGYNPRPSTSITVTASPFTYTNNTGDTINVFVTGGTVTNVALGGNTVAALTNTVIPVPQGASVVVTYSAAPTMTYIGY